MSAIREAVTRFNAGADLLALLGEEYGQVASTNGGEWAGPCPLCGGVDRCRVWPHHEGGSRAWCRGCGAQGDSLTWAVLLAGRDPARHGDTARFLRRHGLLGLAASLRRNPRHRHVPTDRKRARTEAPKRLPTSDLSEVWDRCPSVLEVPDVGQWLRGVRQLNASAVSELDLARALPQSGPLPPWAKAWRKKGFLLVTRMFDAQGRLVNLHARCCLNPLPSGEPKSRNPLGGSQRAAVFANSLARAMLIQDPGPVQDPGPTLPECQLIEAGLVVVEGLPDFLREASRHGTVLGAQRAPAVVGVLQGSWRPELALRVPNGLRVVVVPHADANGAGAQIMQPVIRSLAGRCSVRRLSLGRLGGLS
ncbi:hypothetical protein OAX78_00155 [Planctomycetota bacterium]|nr:hypothetical protein [Planctomycetota bacterium]